MSAMLPLIVLLLVGWAIVTTSLVDEGTVMVGTLEAGGEDERGEGNVDGEDEREERDE